MKVAVYTIAKNERQQVERFMASACEADLVLVLDTGSDDGTPELLVGLGASVHHARFDPWRFDEARNAALALVPEDIDICVALDLDEAFDAGWRSSLEAVWTPGTTRVRYPYVWSEHVDGTPDLTFLADKIHARHGYRWRYPVHEEVTPTTPERWATAPLRLVHRPAPHAHRGRYLALIEQAAEELPDNHRFAYYLAREYGFNRRWGDVLRAGARYLAIPGASWTVERSAVWQLMALAHESLDDHDARVDCLRQACDASPDEREPWVKLAQAHYERGVWCAGLDASLSALAIGERPLHFLTESRAWGALPHDLASICAWQLGRRGLARRQLRAALRIAPDDQRLRANATVMGLDPITCVFAPRGGEVALAGAVVVARDQPAALETTLAGLREWCATVVVASPELAAADHIVADRIVAGATQAERGAALRRAGESLAAEWVFVAFAGDVFSVADGALDALAFADADALALPCADVTRVTTRIVRRDRLDGVELAAGEILTPRSHVVEVVTGIVLAPAGRAGGQEGYIEELRSRVRSRPDDDNAWHAFALVADAVGQRDQAIDAWTRLLDHGSDDALAGWAAFRAAAALHAAGHDVAATAVIARGIARQPGLAELAWLAGWIAWQRGDLARAAAWARIAVANGWQPGGHEPLALAPGRYLPGCFEGPHDLLRHALRARGDHAGAEVAERQYQAARAARLRLASG